MRVVLRLLMAIFAIGIFLGTEAAVVLAASSPVDFAIPVETKRMSYAIALIHRDNTVKILPMDKEVKRATVSPDGARIAYVAREDDHLKVYMCTPDGKNKKAVEDYRSSENNFQDFIDVRFIKNGKSLLIARFLKNQLGFVEYNIASGKLKFLKKSEWQGAPTTIYRTDTYNNGCLVFTRFNNEGNKVIQQIWGANAQDGSYTLFFEIETPPSIVDMVPDMNRKRVFATGTQTRHVSARNANKSLMLITSSKEDPKKLVDDTIFMNLTISNDGNSIIWQSSNYVNGIKFRRYDLKAGKTTEIKLEGSADEKTEAKMGTIVPSK